jgi:Protein of unknown function (DUF6044)/Dolichyl-phosphate-mannose-protein mannosyltransferase
VKFFASMLLVFTALTAVMTYPQVLHLRDGVHDDGDPLLNTWTLTWVAHQLPRAPARLFDANIFYPERKTLAFTETLLLPGTLAAPLHWIGVAPLLVHNLVLLSGFAVSGAGTALLVRSLTGNTAGAILAGIVFAFLPYRIDHMPHLQLQQTQCLPLALWAFHRLLERGRVSDGVWFGVFVAGQVLSCVYYGLFLVPYLGMVCGTMLIAERKMPKRRLIALAVAGLVALIAVLPLARGYLAARQVVGERGRAEALGFSARMYNYLAPPEPNLLYGDVFHRFTDNERRLFPGFVAVALACAAFWPRKHENTKRTHKAFVLSWFRGDPRGAYLLGLLIAFDISLGFNGFTYRVLYDYVLPFRGLRVPARMGLMVGFSLAVLAGYGVARLTEMIRSPSARRSLVVVLGLLMLVEYASKPLVMQIIPTGPSEAYADLLKDVGDSPTAAIFEFPASSADDPTYMYYSTFHWQSLVNGYGGFFPPWYGPLMESMKRFPDGAPVAAVTAHGARYILVHGERLIGDRYRRLIYQLDMRPGLTLVSRRAAERQGQHGEISLYRLSYVHVP